MSEGAKFLHDLRAPLARARTYAKLLSEEAAEKDAELLRPLLLALEEMDAQIRAAEERESRAT